MKSPLRILILTMVLMSVVGSYGDDSPEKRPGREDSEKRKEEWKKLSPEEREVKQKEWRKTNGISSRTEAEKRREQLKNMTPEERAAKRKEIKERLEKRIAELRAKQTSVALSASEVRELDRREQVLKRFEQETGGSPRIERPKPVFTNAPKLN